ncbi:TPA: RHS repeat-associated core domain-containing protein [Vibrio campbellii]|uniref:RHS repeat-associated core domain-containing protein n=1 Tax=Vibrio campbellii TaxID=680 RepID=A0AAE9MVW3_9VIBR|nr:RHS repeat-associated core domain-containing protein [Vibrio campbellii]UTZ21364.1 RHS repeat-associated core domain-containing protein [Vibrio campbellii]UTZ25665.1 RHS repeat-associated core domain-containing protein [Vibrio campbellii]UTZ31254.1 RHS repeat-associated core domain-containing protein [Vibrio campbellii]HDM8042101.1 RHS repeat-associated core domain-containing protein [Vibrio campbellii]|tara:strand:+ start:2148 stop:3278 length:1131 start_codon:yes stop_codon:yes gene_type:complete
MSNKDSVFITPLNRREFLIKIGQTSAVAGGISLLPTSVRLAMAQSMTVSPSHLGFNGEWLDPVLEGYHLGQGYRVYQPKLMRFNAPDSLAPFSEGVHNAYVYCHNDPINFTDPSGHLNISKILFGAFGIIAGIVGIALAAPSGGSSLVLAAGIISGIAGMTSGALQLASGIIDDGDISRKLDIATIPFDIIGVVSGGYSAFKSVQNIRWIRAGGAFDDLTQPGLGSRLWNKIRPSGEYNLEWARKANPAMRIGSSEGQVIATKMVQGGKTMTYTPPPIHGGFTKVLLGQVKVGAHGYTIYQGIMTARSIGSLGWSVVKTIPGRLDSGKSSAESMVTEGRSANPEARKTQLYSLEETRQRVKYGNDVQRMIRQLPLS